MKFLKLFLLLPLILIVINLGLELKAQDKSTSDAPVWLRDPNAVSLHNQNPIPSTEAYNSRWFGEVLGTGTFKSFLNTPGSMTTLSSSTRNLFGAAIVNGIWYGVEYLAAGSGNLVTIDTTTGVITTVAPLSGLIAAHVVEGIAHDKTTNTTYVITTTGTVTALFTINLATGALTTVTASASGLVIPIDIAFTSAGVMYCIDQTTDMLYTVNKTTGAATSVGSLGINLTYAQGMAIDPATDSLFLGAYISTGNAGLYRVSTSTGATSLIGAFTVGSGEVDAMVIPGISARQLNAFNIQTPAASTRIVTVAGSSTPVTITWDTSGSGASYKFIFGTALPTRRLTIPATTNSITTTLGALDIILASNGFTNNGSATDSAVGQWDVWAFKGAGAPGVDSLKSTNGPRAITFRRQQVSLTSFALTAPASGTTIVTSPADLNPVTITWGASGSGATYRWLFKTGATYTDPATLRVLSDGAGLTNSLTLRNSQLDSIVAGLGIAPGDSVSGTWRVRAYSSSDSLNSTAPDRQITFRRVGLLPLAQTFESATFPPLFWTLEGSGTQYWTRFTTAGGYGASSSSAKYDFYTAQTTTGAQTLTSNQFPAVTGPTNYLRFNYAAAYYSATAIDSCIIETSTNAGTTWTRLLAMYQSTALTSGYNSSPIMSTVNLGTGAFTPTSTQWATKILSMPVGTNKVRFVAKSAYGNNLYIDDVTSGTVTGTETPLTLIPEKFELNQNYPNPFNPSTKINFSIPKQAFVSLKIYDMLGREVAQLVNQELTPNTYSIDFNASTLSSGVYFYKLESPGFSDIKRMMLVK